MDYIFPNQNLSDFKIVKTYLDLHGSFFRAHIASGSSKNELIWNLALNKNKVLPFSVLGALIGKQTGRNIEVMNSFELLFDQVDGQHVIDMEYYNTKEEQCKSLSNKSSVSLYLTRTV